MKSCLIKNKTEQKYLQIAADYAVECMKYISQFLTQGVSEIQIARKVKKWFADHKISKLSFPTIVAFGSNAADPHHKPTTRTLTNKDVVVIDMGCVYHGYCSDITRTFLPLKPTKQQLEVYDIVKAANLAGIKYGKVNMKAYELDKICRDVIESKGYGKYFIHSTGHGIGKKVHEQPKIGLQDSTVLKNSMFFTIEPGIYLPNKFGIRIEDTVCFKNDKIYVLTRAMNK